LQAHQLHIVEKQKDQPRKIRDGQILSILPQAYSAQGNKEMMAKDKRPQTGGLQEKKVKLPPTKEEVKQEQKEEKAKRSAKARERRKDKPSIWQRIRDVFAELKKVRWPTAKDTLKHTGIVLAVVVVFSLVVFGIDQGLFALLKLLTRGIV